MDNNYVIISLEYLENSPAASSESATYTLSLFYKQPEAVLE